MTLFIGFSTQQVNQARTLDTTGAFGGPGTTTFQPPQAKKYRLTDEALVIRDLLNALSIKQGEKPGMPSYGTTIWNNLFEPNDSTTTDAIEDEIRRVVAEDSRISLNTVAVWPQDNGVLVEVEIMVIKFNQPMTLGISLNLADGYAKLMPGV